MRLRTLSVLGAVGSCGQRLQPGYFNAGANSRGRVTQAPRRSAVQDHHDRDRAADERAARSPTASPPQTACMLAIQQANAASSCRRLQTLAINAQDDAVNGAHDAAQGAQEHDDACYRRPTVVGVVGPFNSSVAQVEIPVTNAAGLPKCSPANTDTDLTHRRARELYRPTQPGQDAQLLPRRRPGQHPGPGRRRLSSTTTSASPLGLHHRRHPDVRRRRWRLASGEFASDGGTVVKRDSAPNSTTGLHAALHAAPARTGCRLLRRHDADRHGPARKQMRHRCRLRRPSRSWVLTASPTLVRAAPQGATITHRRRRLRQRVRHCRRHPRHPRRASSSPTDYKAMFEQADPGAYSALAYACAQVLIIAERSHKAVAAGTTDYRGHPRGRPRLRPQQRQRFDTVIGNVSLRRERRHDHAVHVVLQDRHDL